MSEINQQPTPPKAGPFRGVPNILTVLRILAIPFFVIAVLDGKMKTATIIFASAGITDILDGMIARRYHQVTRFGSMMDPAADKLLGASAYITFSLMGIIPPWLGALVFTRDVAISLGALVLHLLDMHVVARPTILGKRTTLAQVVTIIMAMLASLHPATAFFRDWGILKATILVTAGLTIASGTHYIARAFDEYDKKLLLKPEKKV